MPHADETDLELAHRFVKEGLVLLIESTRRLIQKCE